MTRSYTFTVRGQARSAGSKRPFVNRKTGKVILVPADAKAKPWMAQVAEACAQAMKGDPPIQGAVALWVTQYVKRPAGHYKHNGSLSAEGRRHPYPDTSGPDLTKAVRAIEDAMHRIAYDNDRRVVEQHNSRLWGVYDEVEIEVRALAEPEGTLKPARAAGR